MSQQELIDTRALEKAIEAQAMLKQHLDECRQRDNRLWQAIQHNQDSLNAKIDGVAERISADVRGLLRIWLSVGGLLLGGLLAIVAKLAISGPPWMYGG